MIASLVLPSVAFGFPSLRPALSGPERTWDVDEFRLHWTEQGDDAPLLVDADGDGRPDSIDAFAQALPAARLAYEGEGWRPIVGDIGVDGSDAIDVYVHQIDAYGYTHAVPGPDGSSCWMEYDSDLSPDGQVAQSVATHELHHCVQFRYTTGLATWIYESAATYEQYTHVVDPALAFPLGILYTERLGDPERKLGAVDGRFEYSAFLWMKYWSERDGWAPDRLPALWDALAGEGDWRTGLDDAARSAFGEDLPTTFLGFSEWNQFACAGDDGAHYLPDVLPCVVDTTVPITPWDGAPIDLEQAESPFTAAYLELPPTRDRVGVECDGVDGLRVGVVPLDPDGVAGPGGSGEGGGTVAANGLGGPVRVVVAATGDAMSATCRTVPVPQAMLRRGPAAGCDQGGVGALGWLTALVAAGSSRRRPRPRAR
jgi:hypothetical protein